jgi:glycine/D-amino acid oxidase-like deaminating enzyme
MKDPGTMTRRTLFKTAGLGALAAGGCAPPPPETTGTRRVFSPVKVEHDRIIRTVVGLRPFRPSGFVVRAEQIGSKKVVHHYGHGGCGVTLSWGTAHLAVDEAHDGRVADYAVIGCGAVGLATARLLQRRGGRVTIYTKDLPPQTTSNIAGAQWQPFTIADRDKRTPAFDEQLEKASRLSHRYFQDLVGDRYGVRWIENYACSEEASEGYREDPIVDLYPDQEILAPGEHPFPFAHVRRFTTLFIETPVYLEAVLHDFMAMGGRLEVRAFNDPSELETLRESVIVNCTGIGAKELFGDEELTPIKGQLTVLLPQPEVDYITLAGNLYMFPRRDGILLGGTTEREVWDLEVNEEAKAAVVEGHARFFAGFGGK